VEDERDKDLRELGDVLQRFGKALIAVGSKLSGKQSRSKSQGALWAEAGRPMSGKGLCGRCGLETDGADLCAGCRATMPDPGDSEAWLKWKTGGQRR
jgi:hypothetical protein